MKIIKVTRDDAFVRVQYATDSLTNPEIHDITTHEAPRPKFDKLLQSLGAIAINILEMNDDAGVNVKSFAIARTKYGTKSVTINFTKLLNATSTDHAMSTPQFRIDPPADSEQGSRECSEKQAKVILDMIEAAEAYLEGDRAQTLLPFPKAKSKEDEEQPEAGADLFVPPAPKKRGKAKNTRDGEEDERK